VVGQPHIRFYAGKPLVDHQGLALGTLCILDEKPGVLSALQKQTLETLSKQVMHIIELRMFTVEKSKLHDVRVEVSKVKTNLLSSMSHELRTPLNGVLGFAALLADTSPSPIQQEYIRDIETCGKHMLTLVNDILTMRAKSQSSSLCKTLESVSHRRTKGSCLSRLRRAVPAVRPHFAHTRTYYACTHHAHRTLFHSRA
jgi:signal transduction histidine kinase